MRQKKEVYYYITKNNYEIDFIVKNRNNKFEIYQVCYDLENLNTQEREIRAIVDASKELNCDNVTLITFDYKEKIHTNNIEINCIGIIEWLLGNN